ncbi:hypothetical protein pipiens_006485, partial [Culex pipiens pipiens]
CICGNTSCYRYT